MKKILILTISILCISGCRGYDIEEILLQREDISLTMKGKDVLVYDPDTFQLSHNAERNEFRVFDDEMGNWFILECQSRPSTEGQEVKASLRWTTTNTTRSRSGLKFTVEKTDSNGHIWLWCEDEAIGVVVREF